MRYLICLNEGDVTKEWLMTLPIQYLVDLRQGQERLSYEGEELPIFHSYDLLEDNTLVDSAFYDTAIPTLKAAYPPPKRATLPTHIQPFTTDGHVLVLTTEHLPTVFDVLSWDGAYWVGEQPQDGYEQLSQKQVAKRMNKQQGKGLLRNLFSKHKEK